MVGQQAQQSWLEQRLREITRWQLVIFSSLTVVVVFVTLTAQPRNFPLMRCTLTLLVGCIPLELLAFYPVLVQTRRRLKTAGISLVSLRELLSFDASGAMLHGNKKVHYDANNLHNARTKERLNMVVAISLFSSWATVFMVAISSICTLWYHTPAPIDITRTVVLGFFIQLPLAVIVGLSSYNRMPIQKSTAYWPRTLLVCSVLAASIAFMSFLAVFWLQGTSPAYLDASSKLAYEASSTAILSLTCCSLIYYNMYFAARIRLISVASFCILLTLLYLPIVASAAHTAALPLQDWLIGLTSAILYFASLHFIRHNQNHTRKHIIKLHHEIHGRHSPVKV